MKRMLIKADDGKASITVTALVITFILLVACMVMTLFGKLDPSSIGWFMLPIGTFAGLYWDRRVRITSSGIDISSDKNCDKNE